MEKIRLVAGFIFISIVAVIITTFFNLDVPHSFAELQGARMDIEATLMDNPVRGAVLFALLYIGAVAFSLPIATALTILAGFLFGSVLGTIIVVVSATVGGSVIFLLARFFFRDFFATRYARRLHTVEEEMASHGFRDVLFLRLIPLVPFSLINIATALTSVRFRDYALATLVGIVPFTFIYVRAGTELAMIERVSDILSLQTLIIISLVVVAIAIPSIIRRRRRHSGRATASASHRQHSE